MRKVFVALLAAFVTAITAHAQSADTDSIRAAIEQWMAQYPESQYADVYKNFFQDYFGPGHILSDQGAARKYLERELAESDRMDGPLLEPTGSLGRFVRVNLSAIADSIIPIDAYFSAFAKSMEDIKTPSADEWRAQWAVIDSVIRRMGLQFPDEDSDRETVGRALRSGDFAVHHSRRYNEAYSRHYRIIRADIVEGMLMPYLSSAAQN